MLNNYSGERRAHELTRSISTFSCRPSPDTPPPPDRLSWSELALRIIVPSDLGNDETSVVCLYAYFTGPPYPVLPLSLPLTFPAFSCTESLPALFKYNFVVY